MGSGGGASIYVWFLYMYMHTDTVVFDTLKIFCKGSVCNIRSGKIMNYIDEGHISPYLGKKIVDTFVQQAKLVGFL